MTIRILRRFHVSVVLQTEENPVVVSKCVGHVSVTSDIYGHALPGCQEETTQRVHRCDGEGLMEYVVHTDRSYRCSTIHKEVCPYSSYHEHRLHQVG